MKNYIKVIGIMSEEQDWKSIVLHIAQRRPSLVINAVENHSWQAGARELMAEGKKIEAIKYCRNLSAMGLVEAKEAVEAL